MPNIKYVCLSDIYFGTDKSIISTSDTDNKNIDVATANPLIEKLMDCLKQVVRKSNCSGVKPILLLNGDAIGSASTERAEVAESFERFIELLTLSCKDLFEKIVYIPGFQDQAIWELVREKQAGKIAWMSKEHSPYATKLFSDSLPKYFHTIKKDFKPVIGSLAPLPLEVGYPSFGVSNADGSKCVVFHHGHFIESIYEFIATLKTLLFSNRKTKCGMQADSFAWVDFFWSTLNRSEEIGLGTDNLYEKLRSPNQIGEWVK
ncbi:MAG: hypothetical protein JNN15_20995, partial [Blastocatellia bacterium]|nr:hypothetical protein [Blastocatellia bacterium]